MRAFQRSIVVMSLAVVMMRPSLAAAQLSSAAGPSVNLPTAVGQKVSVTTEDGKKLKGHLIRLTPTTLEIGEAGVTTNSLALADVQRVEAADSTRNGVIIGALSLGLTGLLAGALVDASNVGRGFFGGSIVLLLGGEPAPIKEPHHFLTGALVGVGVGALVGYAIDAGKEKTIYERRTLGMSVAVSPIVSAASKGVGVQVRW